jgi:CRP-like cAMP-binding protein
VAVDLKSIPLFRGVEADALRVLAERTVTRAVPAETIIFNEGDLPNALYVVISGKVKIYLKDENGKELVLSTKGPGDYFGEMMLDDKPRSASVMSVEPLQVAVLSREIFTSFLLEHPEVALQLIRDLIRVGRGMNLRTRENFRRHLEELENTKVHEIAAVKAWRMAKTLTLTAVLIFASMQFYYLFTH